MCIKFNKYCVSNGVTKAKVWYSTYKNKEGRSVVCLIEKECSRNILDVFPDLAKNESDCRIDYFEDSTVRFLEGSQYYDAALEQAKRNGRA